MIEHDEDDYEEERDEDDPEPEVSGEMCEARHCGWTCTRLAGHSGEHIATDELLRDPDDLDDLEGQHVFDRWPQEEEVQEDELPPMCEQYHAESEYYCTRDKGHDGNHIATAGRYDPAQDRLAVWDEYGVLQELRGKPYDAEEGNSVEMCLVDSRRPVGGWDSVVCTRGHGHRGDHIATSGRYILGGDQPILLQWEQEGSGQEGSQQEAQSTQPEEHKMAQKVLFRIAASQTFAEVNDGKGNISVPDPKVLVEPKEVWATSQTAALAQLDQLIPAEVLADNFAQIKRYAETVFAADRSGY